MILKWFGKFTGWIIPVGFIRKYRQAMNYIRTGYYSVSIPSLESVLMENNVQFIGNRHVTFVGGGIIKTGTRIEAWEYFAGEKYSPNVTIGKNVHIGINCHITSVKEIRIGDDVLFGSNVLISDNNHGDFVSEHDLPPTKRKLTSKRPVIIGNKVWLGDNVIVLSGVTIGDNVIIGANSVVTKNIPSHSIAVGIPAKVIKTIV